MINYSFYLCDQYFCTMGSFHARPPTIFRQCLRYASAIYIFKLHACTYNITSNITNILFPETLQRTAEFNAEGKIFLQSELKPCCTIVEI